MGSKIVIAAASAALFLSAGGLAQAQQSTPPAIERGTAQSSPTLDRSTLREIKDDKAMAQGLNVSAEDLADMEIYGSDDKKIGEVSKVLADSSNSIKAVSVDVGGFLGMGSREVVIPIDKLQKGKEKNRLQTSMTKEEIEKLEEWADRDRGKGTGTSSPSTAPSRTAPSTPPSR